MATNYEHDQLFGGSPATVRAMLRDPDYIRLKCERTGSLRTTVDVRDTADGGFTIVTVRVLPADVPSVARKFVGETITVSETQNWGPAKPDGSASAGGTVTFDVPLSFTGSISMSAGSDGTLVRTTGSFRAGVPFVGGTIEATAVEVTTKYLDAEVTVANEWLSR